MGIEGRTSMCRYRLTAVSSDRTSTIIVYSPIQDAESIRRQFTNNPIVEKTEGFIDDAVAGDPIYEFEVFGIRSFRDRESALHNLDQLQPQLTGLKAALLAEELARDPQRDITQYGYTLHYWHSLESQQENK